MPAPLQVEDIPPDECVRVVQMGPPLGKGSCESRTAWGSDGHEYIMKGSTLLPGRPYIAANEYVCAGLARIFGLPTPAYRGLYHGPNTFFGSRLLASRFHAGFDSELLASCEERDHIYKLVVFDVWVHNPDRYEENLGATCGGDARRARKNCGWSRHTISAFDHGDCLLGGITEPDRIIELVGRRGVSNHILMDCVLKAVANSDRLESAIAEAEAVSDDTIIDVVGRTPLALLPLKSRTAWVNFLISRRDSLREIFEEDRAFFESGSEATL